MGRVRRDYWLAALLLAMLGAAFMWFRRQPFTFALDDAYIAIHNAVNLWKPVDPSFGGAPLVGSTSIAGTVALAILALVFPPVEAAFGLCFIGTALYFAAIAELCVRRGFGWLSFLALLAVGALTGGAAIQLFNGLETSLAMAAVMWSFVLADQPRRTLAILCGLAPFIRPELVLLAAPLMLRQLWMRHAAKEGLSSLAADVALAIAAGAPFLAFEWMTTGTPLPDTGAAKHLWFDNGIYTPLRMALDVVAGLGVGLLSLALLRPTGLGAVALVFFGLFAAAYALSYKAGFEMNWFRYLCVILPVVVWSLAEAQTEHPVPGPWLLGAATALAAASVLRMAPVIATADLLTRDGLRTEAWAEANIPPGTRVLIHDAGAISAAPDLRLVDMVGLKTPSSIAAHRRFTGPSHGKDRWRALCAIAGASGARYVILKNGDPMWSSIKSDLERGGWRLSIVRATPTPGHGYDVYSLSRGA